MWSVIIIIVHQLFINNHNYDQIMIKLSTFWKKKMMFIFSQSDSLSSLLNPFLKNHNHRQGWLRIELLVVRSQKSGTSDVEDHHTGQMAANVTGALKKATKKLGVDQQKPAENRGISSKNRGFHTVSPSWNGNVTYIANMNIRYPLVMTNITMEIHHRNSEFSHEKLWFSIC